MKTVLRVTRRSLESVLVCSYSLSGRFGFNFVSATDYKPPGMPAPPPRQFSTNQPSRTIYRVVQSSVAAGAPGAIRAGQGVMAGRVSSGIRQQVLKLQLCCTVCPWTVYRESPVANVFRAGWRYGRCPWRDCPHWDVTGFNSCTRYFGVHCDKCIIARLCCTEAVNCRMAE